MRKLRRRPGDLIAGLVAGRLAEVETLRLHHGMFSAGISRGTMLSFGHIAASPPLAWHDGEWRETDAGAREPVEATMNVDLVAAVSSLMDEVIAAAPIGPSEDERRASRFTILAEARAPDGTTAQGHVSGGDAYGSTALIAVEAAVRLGARGAPVGAVPPSLAFEPAESLDALKQFGVSWQVGGLKKSRAASNGFL
jgi:hypothetical protein